MAGARRAVVAAGILLVTSPARADLTHDTVSGVAVRRVELDGSSADWSELANPQKLALHVIRFRATGESVEIPHCNGRERVLVDGDVRVHDGSEKGPVVLRFGDAAPAHDIELEVRASSYEKRIACSGPPRVGVPLRSVDGLSLLSFESPNAAKKGGEAVVFVPGGLDRSRPAPLLVGTHPWNGGPWTYAAYAELLDEAGRLGMVLVMPNGLGNSLYVADAEDEVMRAIDAVSREVAIDPQRVSIWGASMGGAGATTISFHHPDRFAFVASYFGDSRYDLTTYVNKILGGEDGARKVNALDVLPNARWLPVFLVHGEDDRTSPIRQSTMLYDAMHAAGFEVDFVRAPGMGHEGPLVVREIRRVVARAATARAPTRPARVSYKSVRPSDTGAYGVTVRRSGAGDAFVDVERRPEGGIRVLAADGVAEIVLAKDALGGTPGEPVSFDARVAGTRPAVRWSP
jgi:predicted esterase